MLFLLSNSTQALIQKPPLLLPKKLSQKVGTDSEPRRDLCHTTESRQNAESKPCTCTCFIDLTKAFDTRLID